MLEISIEEWKWDQAPWLWTEEERDIESITIIGDLGTWPETVEVTNRGSRREGE